MGEDRGGLTKGRRGLGKDSGELEKTDGELGTGVGGLDGGGVELGSGKTVPRWAKGGSELPKAVGVSNGSGELDQGRSE